MQGYNISKADVGVVREPPTIIAIKRNNQIDSCLQPITYGQAELRVRMTCIGFSVLFS